MSGRAGMLSAVVKSSPEGVILARLRSDSLSRVRRAVSKIHWFLVASSTLVPEQQQTVARAVREGGSLQTVTTARIIQELRLKSYALKDESLRIRTELFSRSEINLHLIVTETHLFLALPRLDRTYDLENIIISKDPQALEWGKLLFLYFQSSAEKVDLTTF